MALPRIGRAKKAGMPPGTLVPIDERPPEKARISVLEFDDSNITDKLDVSAADCLPAPERRGVVWTNVIGIREIETLETFGRNFNIHPLVLEDIMHTDQRPKIEDFGSYLFIVMRMFHYDDQKHELSSEQVSLLLGDGFLISFQERPGDSFEPVRERLRTGRGRIRKAGADYLAYALMDAIVDQYFVIVEKIGEHIEDLEDEVYEDPSPVVLSKVQDMRREAIYLRKSIWPLREVVFNMERDASPLIADETDVFLRDLYDHTVRVAETVETHRDMISGLLDIYLSSVSNRMNEVMKVLTIIATIFIPLSFLAGVYGMNFDYLPETGWHYGYFMFWGVIIVIVAGMLGYFWRKGWL